jgi:hypothetical protein
MSSMLGDKARNNGGRAGAKVREGELGISQLLQFDRVLSRLENFLSGIAFGDGFA